MRHYKAVLFLLAVLFLQTATVLGATGVFAPVQKKLVADGYPGDQVARLYESAESAPLYKLVSKTLIIRRGPGVYIHEQYLSPKMIARAQEFQRINRAALDRAEKVYEVDPSVITALLLIETIFGDFTGKTPILSVFSTFALMDQKSSRDKVWELLPKKERAKWNREAFDLKLLQRSDWAYKELRALLELQRKQGIRAESLRGSYMGAIGWPQFLPSSLVDYGADGNADNRIDLYNAEDAIFSTANYLRGHGWCEARTAAQQEEVIWTYNHSKSYVRTVLAIAARLRDSER